MHLSNMLLPTLKETPREAETASHRYMLRAGMIRRVASGIYAYLHLGWRSLQKIEKIVREEMNSKGAQELLFPALQPDTLWKQSGRWEDYGPEMFKLRDRGDRGFCLGPTHEEVFTSLVHNEINSYRDLPLLLYQIQTKYRDEIRPRFGVMRGREFMMKDLYSFDRDANGLDVSYNKMYDAYSRVFERLGLETVAVEADTGAMGGTDSHEFIVRAQTGEAEVMYCDHCGYAANAERATSRLEREVRGAPDTSEEPREVETPNIKTIEELEDFLGASPETMIKTLIYFADGQPVIALIRGCDEMNETKLKNALGAGELTMASGEEIRRLTGAPQGFSGPVGLEGERIIADTLIQGIRKGITGANREDHHLLGVCPGRDFTISRICDLRRVQAGEPCPGCGHGLKGTRGIEVGHIFKLGTKYSDAFEATYLDVEGEEQAIVMGSYGIGLDRTMAAVIEQHHDEQGICWPVTVAPYEVIILPLAGEGALWEAALDLYQALGKAGLEVAIDDRPERAGVKFHDADLIGIPLRITLGARSFKEGQVEFRLRQSGREWKVPVERAAREAEETVEELKARLTDD